MKKYIELANSLISEAKEEGYDRVTITSGMIDEVNTYDILNNLRSYYQEKGYKVKHTNDFYGVGTFIEIYC